MPSPPQGWAALAWEVSVVFLGIVLALAADQLVDRAHWNKQVRDFQKALAVEIGTTLGTYEYRQRQDDCAGKRLAELERWCAVLETLRRPFLFGGQWRWLACVAALRADGTGAVTYLRRAFADGLPMEMSLHHDPYLNLLRGYAPFDALMTPGREAT